MEVLILFHIKVVERVAVGWFAVALSKVNSNIELDLTAPEHILEEGVALLEV